MDRCLGGDILVADEMQAVGLRATFTALSSSPSRGGCSGKYRSNSASSSSWEPSGEECRRKSVSRPSSSNRFQLASSVAGIDGEEEGEALADGRLVIARGVADHQRVARRIMPSQTCRHSFLVPASCPQMATTYRSQIVFIPFAFEGFVRCGGDDEHVGRGDHPLQASRGRTQTAARCKRFLRSRDSQPRTIRAAASGPHRPILARLFPARDCPAWARRATQSRTDRGTLDLYTASERLQPRGGGRWSFRDQGRKAINAAALGVEIDKVARLAGILAHAGQPIELDKHQGRSIPCA